MYFNHIKNILIDLKLFKIDLLLNQTLKYLIICVGSILAQVLFWDTTTCLLFEYTFSIINIYSSCIYSSNAL